MSRQTLTKRQRHILILLYRFRYLNRQQIQTFLNHKSHSLVIEWLNALVELGYITPIPLPKLNDAPNPTRPQPTIYALAKDSLLKLRELGDIDRNDDRLRHRLYSESRRSGGFVIHCLRLADFCLGLQRLVKDQPVTLRFSTKAELMNIEDMLASPPDVFFVLTDTNDSASTPYFVDLIDSQTPRFAMRARMKQYFAYAAANTWQEQTQTPFPRLLLICPNRLTLNFLKRHIKKIYRLSLFVDTPDFYLAIWEDVAKHSLAKEAIEQVGRDE